MGRGPDEETVENTAEGAEESAAESDAELVARIVNGADAARAEAVLYARYQRRVYLYGLKHLKDPDAAWDLTQEVLVLAMRKIRERALREPERVGSFLLGTCRLLATSERRRHARRRALLLRYSDPTEAEAPTPNARTDLDRVAHCLGALSEREQTVLLLSYYAELDATAIGAELGTSAGNVRVLRHRAFERLHGCVQRGEKVTI